MFPTKVLYFLNFFDIFGYNSGSSKISSNQKCACFIYIVHILLAVFYTFDSVRFYAAFSTLLPIETINAAIQLLTVLYCFWLIIRDSIFYRKEHQIFWKTFEKLYEFFPHSCNSNFGHIVFKIVEHSIITTLCMIVTVIYNGFLYGEIVIPYNLLIKMCEFRSFYYVFCVEVLYNQIKTIKVALTQKKSKTRFWSNSNGFHWVREYYSSIYNMAQCLNTVFGMSQVGAIMYLIYMLLSNLNWLQAHLNEKTIAFDLGSYFNENIISSKILTKLIYC